MSAAPIEYALPLFGDGEVTALVPLALRADDRKAEPDNIISLDAARTRKATTAYWRARGF
jgi:hypothetical protein